MPVAPRSLKDLFLEALAVPPAIRQSWVAAECAHDAELRRQLELMLAAHDAPQSLLDRAAPLPPTSGPATENFASAQSIYSFHPHGTNAEFADGSVHYVEAGIDIRIFAHCVTRAGGEIGPLQ